MVAAPRVFPAAAVIQGLDPLQWTAEPFARISSNITMTAETVASTNGVEYRFTCTAGGGPSSGWQLSTSYTATVSAQTKYTYQVEVRDRVTQSALRDPSGEITLQPPPADRIDTAIGSEIEVISYKVIVPCPIPASAPGVVTGTIRWNSAFGICETTRRPTIKSQATVGT